MEEGESRFYPILFNPKTSARSQATIDWGDDVTTTIYGTGVIPFSLVDSTILMEWNPEEGARIGSIQIKNPASQKVEISLAGE